MSGCVVLIVDECFDVFLLFQDHLLTYFKSQYLYFRGYEICGVCGVLQESPLEHGQNNVTALAVKKHQPSAIDQTAPKDWENRKQQAS